MIIKLRTVNYEDRRQLLGILGEAGYKVWVEWAEKSVGADEVFVAVEMNDKGNGPL